MVGLEPMAITKMLCRDLLRLKAQIAAVALVVGCGIATYVTMRGAHDALVAAQVSYYQGYRFAEVFAQLKRAPDSITPKIKAIPGVASIETRVVEEVMLDVPGLSEPATGRLVSIPETRQPILNDICIRNGRYIDIGQRDEVVISESFAEANDLNPGDRIAAVINGVWEKLRIVGVAISPEYVYEIRGAEVLPDKKRFGVVWMSRSALGSAFNMDGAFNDVSVSLSPGASEADVIDHIDRLLERYGGLGAYGRSDQVSHRFLSDEIAQDRITGIFVPMIFLGIAAFLINIVLSRLVATQRAQIAVLKAFGYGNLRLASHYLVFALAAMFVGSAAGVATGMWMGKGLANLYTQYFKFPSLEFHAGVSVVGLGILVSAVPACLGAITSVMRVVSLPPAEAMRPEGPAAFRPGILERWGLERALSPSVRMIVRNIGRRKMKAALAIVAVSLSVTILVVGRYFYDAIDYIIAVQFGVIQREDVTVSFTNPRSASARYDIEHLSGVVLSEPFRVVPARLRFEYRSRRIAVMGLTQGGELKRLTDRHLSEVPLPSEGLVLTTKLAEVLGVKPGDRIAVEVLEGKRPVKDVAVSGVVDEMIGMSAYMDIRALNRLMEEGGTISGASLSVDSKAAPGLYKRLKRIPTVAGTAIREAMLQSFKETIAANLAATTTALIIFACAIAFGVVYNGARIALSERAIELASLRVLGFTRKEIAFILLGEQAILSAVAIPLGFLMGYGISAGLALAMQSELYRMPLVITSKTYAFSFLVVAIAAVVSGLLVLARLYLLDLVAALKVRE